MARQAPPRLTQKWICVPPAFDYKEGLWRVAFGFRALIFLRRHFPICRGERG